MTVSFHHFKWATNLHHDRSRTFQDNLTGTPVTIGAVSGTAIDATNRGW
jgi:hypothetical protein